MSGGVWGLVRCEIQRPFHKIKNFQKNSFSGAEFPYLGMIAKIQFSCIPWIATALSNSTFINYVNITFPCWNGLIMQENWIFAIMPKYGNSAPGPQKITFFGNFWFLWKGLWISLLTSPQPPPDIKFKSSYARKRDFSLLCPKMEIQPQAPKNGIFQKRFIFWKGLQISLPTSPQPPPDINFKSSYAKRDFGLLCPNLETRPQAPKMEFFKKVSFFWKGLQISLLTSPQPPADIKFKSSYARKRDFDLLCPNMEIRPQNGIPEWNPKNGIFQKIFIFLKRSSDFASNEPSTTCRHKV